MSMAGDRPPVPTLPVERTELAWERCTLGVLVNGVLALVRQHGAPTVSHYLAASVAALLALAVVLLGRRRSRVIRGAAAPRPLPAPRREVIGLGTGVLVLAAVMLVLVVQT